jgi:hypothetical protein
MTNLSFRSSTNTLIKVREQIRRLLQLNSGNSNNNMNSVALNGSKNLAACREAELAFSNYMRRVADTFDLAKNEEVGGNCASLSSFPEFYDLVRLQKLYEFKIDPSDQNCANYGVL